MQLHSGWVVGCGLRIADNSAGANSWSSPKEFVVKERTIIPGILFGIVLGVATLYGGVLLSTWLPIPFVFYGLPLPSLVVLGVLAMSVYMLKKDRLNDRSWRAFAFTFAAAFVVPAFLWVSTISGYGNFA